ncbi:MAG TPA: CopG family transcriptional regulator [Solirubrobacterales bacterium]|nr:CopG family transcriptional regulator [Solirubrobacterales bacterium]
MRTTVTLDPDVAAKLKRLARERDISFKEALNTSVRRGIERGEAKPRPYRIRTRDLGVRPGVNLDKALQLAGEMEDAETIRKLRLGK